MSSTTTPSPMTNDNNSMCWTAPVQTMTNHNMLTTSCGDVELGGSITSSIPFHQEPLRVNQTPNVDSASRISSSLMMDSSLLNFTPLGLSPNSIMDWNQTFAGSSASSGSPIFRASFNEDLSSKSLYNECNHQFNNEASVEDRSLDNYPTLEQQQSIAVFLRESGDHEELQRVVWDSGDGDPQNHPPQINHPLPFSNSTPFWDVPFSSSQFVTKQKLDTIINKISNSEASSRVGAKKGGSVCGSGSGREYALKKPRIETPSPLPTFKVRKEKLGDRITALQQLVAPFGKTDTASVLQEAIEYIKFLHEQVGVLSSPYLKDAVHGHIRMQKQQQQKMSENVKVGGEDQKLDLRSRGLCLVPIPSTFHVATDAPTVDFWTSTFGGTFR